MTGRLTRTARAEEDLIAIGLRYVPVGNYLILYRETEQGAEIVRYLHGRRNLPRALDQHD